MWPIFRVIVGVWAGLNVVDDVSVLFRLLRLGAALLPGTDRTIMCNVCDDVMGDLLKGAEGFEALPCTWACLAVPGVNIQRPRKRWFSRAAVLPSHERVNLGVPEQFAHDVPEALVDMISLESWQQSLEEFNTEVEHAVRKRARFLRRSEDDMALAISLHLMRMSSLHLMRGRGRSRRRSERRTARTSRNSSASAHATVHGTSRMRDEDYRSGATPLKTLRLVNSPQTLHTLLSCVRVAQPCF